MTIKEVKSKAQRAVITKVLRSITFYICEFWGRKTTRVQETLGMRDQGNQVGVRMQDHRVQRKSLK